MKLAYSVVLYCIVLCFYTSYVVSSNFDCIGTCYSGRILPEPEDIYDGKQLRGFSYKNITTDDPKKCYSFCIQDCRCKACQMKDGRCELLDEDKTSKADTFMAELGYVYYDLKQTMFQGKSHMVPAGSCYNGCCKSNPCMNGGTCVQHCQSPKEKFTCLCSQKFSGKVCEIALYFSCMDVMQTLKTVPNDGVYTIIRTDNFNTFPVYCDFDGPNNAWTLIESFSLEKSSQFDNKPLYLQLRVNPDDPLNWHSYRNSLHKMKLIKQKSTLFRSTCDFPKRNGTLTPDLLIGYLSEWDIINKEQILLSWKCLRHKFIDIRGHQCTNCTAYSCFGSTWHSHLDVTWGFCEYKPPVAKKNVNSFGFYTIFDSKFKCTATPQSTTQWWLGEER